LLLDHRLGRRLLLERLDGRLGGALQQLDRARDRVVAEEAGGGGQDLLVEIGVLAQQLGEALGVAAGQHGHAEQQDVVGRRVLLRRLRGLLGLLLLLLEHLLGPRLELLLGSDGEISDVVAHQTVLR